MPSAPEPLFFASAKAECFGCYHAAAGSARKTPVLLCPPFGHEYIRGHRSLQLLATRLAAAGFHCLRFDPSGCGDSAGGLEEVELADWVADVASALRVLQARLEPEHAGPPCLIGARLGASLAAQASAEVESLAALVLWDPVVNGTAHVEQLRSAHQAMLQSAHVIPDPRESSANEEILGFDFPPDLSESLQRELDLFASGLRTGPEVMLLDSGKEEALEAYGLHLQQKGASVTYLPTDEMQPWTWAEDVARAVIPAGLIATVVEFVSERCP
jgi:pimeloyl-ACP methyl ester carboxylesterase